MTVTHARQMPPMLNNESIPNRNAILTPVCSAYCLNRCFLMLYFFDHAALADGLLPWPGCSQIASAQVLPLATYPQRQRVDQARESLSPGGRLLSTMICAAGIESQAGRRCSSTAAPGASGAVGWNSRMPVCRFQAPLIGVFSG